MSIEKIEDISQEEEEEEDRSDFLLLFVDSEDSKPDDACISAKIQIFAKEHPSWGRRKLVAAAIGYCKRHKKKDAKSNIEISNTSNRVTNISLARFASLIKTLKSKKGLKVPHMAVGPFKTELSMKNLNRLQTKMEKMTTEEQKFLTQEELQQRSEYARRIKKEDAEELNQLFKELVDSILDEYPIYSQEEIVDAILYEKDNYWVNSLAEIQSINDGLNNIIKFPIILAREMVQKYGDTYHFKPYKELKKASKGVDKLPIMIEHHDSVTKVNTIGWVKQIKSDDKLRGIRGIGYVPESKLPRLVLDAIKRGEIVKVSIGFFARLGDAGTFNGKKYDATQEDIVLEHLAICIDSIPRCPPPACGINADSENPKTTIISKDSYIIDNDNYLFNLCEIFRNKKETIKQTPNIEKGDIMTNDSFADPKSGKLSGDEPKDFEYWLTKFRAYINGVTEKELQAKYKKRIRKTFKDSDEEMSEKELKVLQDAIAEKDIKLAELEKKLADADKFKADIIEKERQKKLKEIKEFAAGKYKDEYLDSKNLEQLELIADAVSVFAPSYEKPDELPKAGKDEELRDGEKVKRIHPSEIFAKKNEEFDLSGI
jgi:hypothetical protein